MRIELKSKRGSAERANRGARGYTFAEVLVAAGILGFTSTSLYAAFSAGFCLIQTTRENLRATQIMVQKLEAVRLFTWSQVCDTTNYLKSTFTETYNPMGVSDGTKGTSYNGSVSASLPADGELPEAYRTNMRTITVSLNWTNYNGARPIVHQRQMTTRVARYGMQNYIWGDL
jgi:hypothetical protein